MATPGVNNERTRRVVVTMEVMTMLAGKVPRTWAKAPLYPFWLVNCWAVAKVIPYERKGWCVREVC